METKLIEKVLWKSGGAYATTIFRYEDGADVWVRYWDVENQVWDRNGVTRMHPSRLSSLSPEEREAIRAYGAELAPRVVHRVLDRQGAVLREAASASEAIAIRDGYPLRDGVRVDAIVVDAGAAL